MPCLPGTLWTLDTISRKQSPQTGSSSQGVSVCLINPRFDPSYWGFDYALPLYPGNRRSSMMTGALPHLAGLASGHDVTVIDENVEEIDFEALGRFDLVGVTGMIVQKERMREILLRLRELDVTVAVGGPYAAVDESFFAGLCDVIFLGEADTTWPQFLTDFAAGRPVKQVYEQSERSDMTVLPKPRYDLMKADKYASGSLQFSRGCPFQCEFCDIIVIFGRKPRNKTPAQVIAELGDLWRAGFFSVFIVDDNFIGNKKLARTLLREIVAWQEANGYPVRLSTEASINLADDPEMLELMYRANFRYVFVGIETPRIASLLETKKNQNVRGDSLAAKLERIQNAGLDVHAGFIVGFDNDDKTIFEEQYRFIQDNGILLAMVGMLSAIPKTPLYERLAREDRLNLKDPNCSIVPKQMTAEELKAGYAHLMSQLYSAEAFLERYFHAFQLPEFLKKRAAISTKASEGKLLPTLGYGLILLFNLVRALAADGSLLSVGRVYLRYFVRHNLRYRSDVIGFAQFMNRCVTHWHFYKFTREMTAGRLRLISTN